MGRPQGSWRGRKGKVPAGKRTTRRGRRSVWQGSSVRREHRPVPWKLPHRVWKVRDMVVLVFQYEKDACTFESLTHFFKKTETSENDQGTSRVGGGKNGVFSLSNPDNISSTAFSCIHQQISCPYSPPAWIKSTGPGSDSGSSGNSSDSIGSFSSGDKIAGLEVRASPGIAFVFTQMLRCIYSNADI